MRQRWFGATGRKVPEIVLDGSLDLTGALVLDRVEDGSALEAAHRDGVPVAVRAATAEEVLAALARPEVSCVVVRETKLLELDLAALTYGD
jgi:hypothetical protein